MGDDIRLPIGSLFTLLGLILTIYGAVTGGSELYSHSLGMNVNLWTGLGMLVFGLWFLLMAFRKKSKAEKK
jgi:predicted MFS family arabinose efflux permease